MVLVLASQALEAADASQAEGVVVLYRAGVHLDVVGVTPSAAEPADGQLATGTGPPSPGGNGTGVTAQTTGEAPAAASETDQQELRKIAKLYAQLKPATAGALLMALEPDQARTILLSMQGRDAAKIVDQMFPAEGGESEASPEADARKQLLLEILGGSPQNGSPSNP